MSAATSRLEPAPFDEGYESYRLAATWVNTVVGVAREMLPGLFGRLTPHQIGTLIDLEVGTAVEVPGGRVRRTEACFEYWQRSAFDPDRDENPDVGPFAGRDATAGPLLLVAPFKVDPETFTLVARCPQQATARIVLADVLDRLTPDQVETVLNLAVGMAVQVSGGRIRRTAAHLEYWTLRCPVQWNVNVPTTTTALAVPFGTTAHLEYWTLHKRREAWRAECKQRHAAARSARSAKQAADAAAAEPDEEATGGEAATQPTQAGWYAAAHRAELGYLLHVFVLFLPPGFSSLGPPEAQVLVPGIEGFIPATRIVEWGPKVAAPRVVMDASPFNKILDQLERVLEGSYHARKGEALRTMGMADKIDRQQQRLFDELVQQNTMIERAIATVDRALLDVARGTCVVCHASATSPHEPGCEGNESTSSTRTILDPGWPETTEKLPRALYECTAAEDGPLDCACVDCRCWAERIEARSAGEEDES